MKIAPNVYADLKNENQESDLIIWEDVGDQPRILYDSHKTNNDIDYLKSMGIHISVTGHITKVEL